jgi:hypothetical protein
MMKLVSLAKKAVVFDLLKEQDLTFQKFQCAFAFVMLAGKRLLKSAVA